MKAEFNHTARVELDHGVPNQVGTDGVGVWWADAEHGRAELSVNPLRPDDDYENVEVSVGGLVTISGVTWRVLSVHDRPEAPPDSPPGTGAGTVAVVIERDPPGPLPVVPRAEPFASAQRVPPTAPGQVPT